MNKRILALLAGVIAVALFAAGCGSSDDSTDTSGPLTKADFIKQGNEVCAAGNKEIQEGFQDFAEESDIKQNTAPSEEQLEEVAETVLIPAVEKQISGIRALEAPSGEEKRVDAFLDNAEKTLEEVEEDPSELSGEKTEPFTAVNKEAHALGLNVCGEE